MKHLDIQTIPQSEQRFTTIGDWWEKRDTLHVRISELSDWRFYLAVLFHELSEYFCCQAHGIKTKECDAFDAWFEKQYELGTISKSKEAGDDKRCPYYKGHQIGAKYERFTIRILGASWKKYNAECDRLMGVK